ncbi:ABC transporter ATP-binding protein [Hydrogenophaga bisanensis]|uniref:ABC transporter ATP-binding protein n=1 Tax=Hydrogenophaga bisanensis TaxID=439611 RepID=A0ABW2R4Q4_9BURK
MASITLNNATVDIPIYNASTRSLKTTIIKAATGGIIASDNKGRVIIRALDSINLSLRSGDRVGIIGHNGAGKSTMLRLLSRIYTPTSGTAEIIGSIGTLLDIGIGIDPESTGMENIQLRGTLLGISDEEIKAHTEEIIEFSDLGDFIHMPLRTYSTGMQLRLAFAISTMVRPDILIMDEWMSVGDEGFKHKAKERMNAMVGSSKILIVATHSAELIQTQCNKVIWLEHGKIKMEGSPEDIAPLYFNSGL